MSLTNTSKHIRDKFGSQHLFSDFNYVLSNRKIHQHTGIAIKPESSRVLIYKKFDTIIGNDTAITDHLTHICRSITIGVNSLTGLWVFKKVIHCENLEHLEVNSFDISVRTHSKDLRDILHRKNVPYFSLHNHHRNTQEKVLAIEDISFIFATPIVGLELTG